MSSHRVIALNVSAVYIGIIAMLRLTVDASVESQRTVTRMADRANALYEQALSAIDDRVRLKHAAMTLAIYDIISETEGLSRVVVDRIAQCDVQRRRRRLQRTVESLLLVPTTTEAPDRSVSQTRET